MKSFDDSAGFPLFDFALEIKNFKPDSKSALETELPVSVS